MITWTQHCGPELELRIMARDVWLSKASHFLVSEKQTKREEKRERKGEKRRRKRGRKREEAEKR